MWPQMTLLIWFVVSITIVLVKHGETTTNNFFISAIVMLIEFWILKCGGFWTPFFK